MTVIYSNFNDTDTTLLRQVWEGLENVRVIEITRDMIDYEDIVDEAIASEDDTIIFAGHGTTCGLLHPNLYICDYVVHENNIHLIHARNVIGIWCHASEFAQAHHLNGLFTSMFISNLREAWQYGYSSAVVEKINESCVRFYGMVNALLKNNTPISEWRNNILSQVHEDDGVEMYNYNGVKYLTD